MVYGHKQASIYVTNTIPHCSPTSVGLAQNHRMQCSTLHNGRGSIQSFIQRGGGGGIPPRNVAIEYGYYCGAINISYLILHVTGRKYIHYKVA